VGAGVVRFDRRAHARAAGPDDEHVVLRLHVSEPIGWRPVAVVLRRYSADRGSVLRIDRHRLGPRVYVLGARVHEWHLGAVLLLGLAVGALFDRVGVGVGSGVALVTILWGLAADMGGVYRGRGLTLSWEQGLRCDRTS